MIPESGKFPWRREWQPAPVFFPGESHGQRNLGGSSPWGHKETDETEPLILLLSLPNPLSVVVGTEQENIDQPLGFYWKTEGSSCSWEHRSSRKSCDPRGCHIATWGLLKTCLLKEEAAGC